MDNVSKSEATDKMGKIRNERGRERKKEREKGHGMKALSQNRTFYYYSHF